MGQLFDTRLHRDSAAARQVAERCRDLLSKIAAPLRPDQLGQALLAELERGDRFGPSEVAALAGALESGDLGDEVRAKLWSAMVARAPERGLLRIGCGDTLLAMGRQREAAEILIEAVERAPAEVDEFVEDIAAVVAGVGDSDDDRAGALHMRLHLAQLRAALRDIADGDSSGQSSALGGGLAAEDVRERYSELLESSRDYGPVLAQVRELGAVIRELEERGVLPQAFMRRGSWRRS
ncbi:MAG: hypothetical protein AAGC55_15555 [Myxococcota bacterium]